jgi:glycosyltransferase involved in cell wall biosynthesis
VISPPTLALPGWLLSRIWKAPLIYDIQDMWPETLASTQMMKSSWSATVVGWFMNRIYRACASIRVISPGFRNDLIGKGIAKEKVHYVPNWVDTEFYAPRANENAEGLGKRFRVVYAGNIGSSQGLGVVLDAAEVLRDEAAVEFVLAGDGVDLRALKLAAADRRLENVRFLGRLALNEMPLLYSTADALLVHLRDEPVHRITIPHKTLAYLAAGKPVIAAVRGDVAEVVCAAEAGIACEPDSGMALAEAVKKLAAMPEPARLKLAQNARTAACREYSRVAVVRKLEGLCRNAVETSRVSPLARRSEA